MVAGAVASPTANRSCLDREAPDRVNGCDHNAIDRIGRPGDLMAIYLARLIAPFRVGLLGGNQSNQRDHHRDPSAFSQNRP